MVEKLDLALLGGKAKCEAWLERLAHEEKGASDMVAIMLVIVILIAVAAIFKNGMINAINEVFTKLINWINQ